MSSIPTPHDVNARLGATTTGLLERAREVLGGIKSMSGGIHVKIQHASDEEVRAVTAELQNAGWSVGRGKVNGAPVLVLTPLGSPGAGSPELDDTRTSSGVIHTAPLVDTGNASLFDPDSPRPAGLDRAADLGAAGHGPAAREVPRTPQDQTAVVRIVESSKSLAEAAAALHFKPSELEAYMRAHGIKAPPAWSSPPEVPPVDVAHTRNVVSMAASAEVAARKLGITVDELRQRMGAHNIAAPQGWTVPPTSAPRGTGG